MIHCHCELSSPDVCAGRDIRDGTRAALRFTRAAQKTTSSPGVRRSFCAECGSPIAYQTDRRADIVDLRGDVERSVVGRRRVTSTRKSSRWFEIADDLPRFARGAVARRLCDMGRASRRNDALTASNLAVNRFGAVIT